MNIDKRRWQKLAGILKENQENINNNILEEFIECFDTSGGYQGSLEKGTERSVVVDKYDYTKEEDEGEYDIELDVFDRCYSYLQKQGGTAYLEKYKTTFNIINNHTISFSWIQE